MKKQQKKILTIFLVAATAVGSYFIASTFAKCTSTITGTGGASVANGLGQ